MHKYRHKNNKTIDYDGPLTMTKGQNWGPGDFNMTLDSMIDLKGQLARTAQWKKKMYDLETPKVEKKLLAEKLNIQNVLEMYDIDQEQFTKRIEYSMDEALKKPKEVVLSDNESDEVLEEINPSLID